MPHDSTHVPDERGWLVTPRALTTLATVVSLVYTLHQPVRYVMHVAADVDALQARVAALEGELADRRRADEGRAKPWQTEGETGGASAADGPSRIRAVHPSSCAASRPASCP